MNTPLETIFSQFGIQLYGCIPFSACRITLARKLPQQISLRAAIVFAIPYFPGEDPVRNISLYAVPRDYHLYTRQLFPPLLQALQDTFPGARFFGFSDNSPIDERTACVKAGLGIYGDNGLLITKPYGSFVFLAEILTDYTPEQLKESGTVYAEQSCEHCGACQRVCPMRENPFGISECLSALTQKKQLDSAKEQAYIRQYGSAWGCDLCQTVCPHNKLILQNGVPCCLPFFREKRIFHLRYEQVAQMPDSLFKTRAFAWRGKQTVLRNLRILEQSSTTSLQLSPVNNRRNAENLPKRTNKT